MVFEKPAREYETALVGRVFRKYDIAFRCLRCCHVYC